jgi:protein tyrosine phosphatase (PTP) superfamily phosphohydrolase (DUF442 family)
MRLHAHPFTIAALAVLFTSVPSAPWTGRPDADPPSKAEAPRIRIDNFGQIDERFYRGAQPKGEDYAALAALGVRTVIDLQADGNNADEVQHVNAAGMNFVRIAMTGHVPPTPEQIATLLAIVDDPDLAPVYVHCKVGKHRTGVMAAVYRMERYAWAPEQAFQEMKRFHFGWDFLHPEFKGFVHAYQPGGLPPVTLRRVTAGEEKAGAASMPDVGDRPAAPEPAAVPLGG